MAHNTVTRAELSQALVAKAGVTRTEAAEFVDIFLDALQAALSEGEQVKLSRFGNFVVRSKKARTGRNPKTGDEAEISPRRVVTFRPSELLRERVERATP